MKKPLVIIIFTILTLITIFIVACKKQTCSTWSVPPPSSLALAIEENGITIEDSVKRQLKFFYYEGTSRKDLELVVDDSLLGAYIQGKGFIGLDYKIYQLLREKGVKTYFFEFPDGFVDTLWLNMEYVETCQAKKEKCQCEYPIRNVTYNGKVAKEHELSWTMGTPLYILER